MQTTKQTTQTGFTLIELLIAVAIVALLAAIAVPQYNGYVEKARRTDATTALTRIAGQLERCYTERSVYNHANCTSYTDVNKGDVSEDGHYDLTIAAAAGGTAAQSFQLTATAKAGGSQATDEKCKTFTLTNVGLRSSTPGPEATTNCW